MAMNAQRHRLKDGTEVVLRTPRPDDRALIRSGFAGLSGTSRYRRFFHYKATLSDDDLKFVEDPDGIDNFALGVVSEGASGPVPMGLGRIARTEHARR